MFSNLGIKKVSINKWDGIRNYFVRGLVRFFLGADRVLILSVKFRDQNEGDSILGDSILISDLELNESIDVVESLLEVLKSVKKLN